MKSKIFAILLVVSLMLSFTSAITGSIGNARMILRVETGEEVEKYILVKNVNDVLLNITLTPLGDLAGNVNIEDDFFVLLPRQDKKVMFTIKATEEGTTETKINVLFAPQDGSNGVGLSSTIVVIAKDEGWEDDVDTGDGFDVVTGDVVVSDDDSKTKINPAVLFFIVILVVFILLLIVLLILVLVKKKRVKTKQKKRVKKGE